MKLILRNIGKIKEAEIDLDKQLTVFFGPNNNGKTYVSYCLYGLSNSSNFWQYISQFRNVLQINVTDLIENGNMDIDLNNLFLPLQEELKSIFIQGYKNLLPELFGNGNIDYTNSEIYPVALENELLLKEYVSKFQFSFFSIKILYGFELFFEKKQNGIVSIKVSFVQSNKEINVALADNLFDWISDFLLRSFLSQEIQSSFFLPAERIGIAVFGKELVLNRFKNTSGIVKLENFTTYSSVINDAIQRQFQMNNLQSKKINGDFVLLAEELEKEILQGKLTVNETGDAFYSNENLEPLSILSSASTIKSLSSLVFYLRYFAAKGQTLFIDEPEINLHPDNQRKIARFLAKLSNAGIKIFLSTHSDYLLREFNTLLMLNKSSDETDKLMEKYGFKKEEVLSHKNVGAYLFKDGFAKEIEVTETGFSAETIDETISEQNKAFNDIRWTLFED